MKVIVISIDALITEDIPEIKKQPNMGALMSKCAIARNIYCVYPTITYPCHTAIMTGCWPEHNGIYQNELFETSNDRHPFYWTSNAIKVPTMVDIAKKNGLTTASVAWPVMGANPSIDYNITEIWPVPKEEKYSDAQHLECDSPCCIEIYNRYKHFLDNSGGTAYDNFAAPCAVDVIKQFKPDFMFIHFSHLDSHRHGNGYETSHNLEAIKFIDEKIGLVVQATKDAGVYDDTTFVLLGDHGQMNVHSVFSMNTLLAKMGYITYEDGLIKDWRIYLQGSGFSGQIFTRNIDKSEALSVLRSIMEEYPQYIERVLTADETKELYHLSGPFDFTVEGQNHIVLGQRITDDVKTESTPNDQKYYRGSHGYTPEKGTDPAFIICGERAKEVDLPYGRLIDEAPTIMKLFGLSMPDCDGHALDMIN